MSLLTALLQLMRNGKSKVEFPPDCPLIAEGEVKLFRLSDSSGELKFSLQAKGKIGRDQLDSNDAFILDTQNEIFAWIGKGASVKEKQKALQYAQVSLFFHTTNPQSVLRSTKQSSSLDSNFSNFRRRRKRDL